MAKQDTPGQHNVLHQFWPTSCCLCDKELENGLLKYDIKELQDKIEKLQSVLQKIADTKCSESYDGYTGCSCTYNARAALVDKTR